MRFVQVGVPNCSAKPGFMALFCKASNLDHSSACSWSGRVVLLFIRRLNTIKYWDFPWQNTNLPNVSKSNYLIVFVRKFRNSVGFSLRDMSFPDSRSPLMTSLQGYCVDNEEQYGPALKRAKTCGEIQSTSLFYPNMSSDSIGFWPRCDQHSQFEQQIPPLKKPRISEEAQSISLPCPPMKAVMSNNAIGFWTQLSTKKSVDQHPQFEQHAKPRIPEESQSYSLPYPLPMNARMTASNARVNNGANNIFFKTRLCAKFIVGKCKNGENCNFAHGIEDMRQTFNFQ